MIGVPPWKNQDFSGVTFTSRIFQRKAAVISAYYALIPLSVVHQLKEGAFSFIDLEQLEKFQ